MEARRTDRGRGRDPAYWRGDLMQLWLLIVEYVILVGGTALVLVLGTGFLSWLLLVGVLIVAWLLPVIILIPRTASSNRQGVEDRD